MILPIEQSDFLLSISKRLQSVKEQLTALLNKRGHETIDKDVLANELYAIEMAIYRYDPTLQLDNLTQYANHFLALYEQTRQRPQNHGNRFKGAKP